MQKIENPKWISLTDVKDGDVLLCVADPKDCISWAITYFSDAEVSHAALSYKAKENLLVDVAGEHVRTAYLTDYLNDGRPIHVMRYKDSSDLSPVLKSATHYLKEQEPYANSTLFLLAFVLLFNKSKPNSSFAKKELTKLINLVCGEIIRLINKVAYKNKEPFICSQFVAENFNQAYHYEPFKQYKLNFTHLNSLKAINKTEAIDTEYSLYKYALAQANEELISVDNLLLANNANHLVLGDTLDTLCEVMKKIIFFFDHDAKREANTDALFAQELGFKPQDEELIDKEFILATKNLAMAQYSVLHGVSKISMKDLYAYFNTLENYFITPGNLLFNCSSLEYIGTLSAKS